MSVLSLMVHILSRLALSGCRRVAFVLALQLTACDKSASGTRANLFAPSAAKAPATLASTNSAATPFIPKVAVDALKESGPCRAELRGSFESHLVAFVDEAGVSHKGVVLSPGERLCLFGDPSEKELTELGPSVTPNATNRAQKQLIMADLIMGDGGSVLAVKNFCSKPLRYRAAIRLPDRPGRRWDRVCRRR